MIEGLVQLFLWQALGEAVSKFFLPNMPGPVLGLLFLLAFLYVKGEVNQPLGLVADSFRQHLGLLFVPASVGVVLFLPDLKSGFYCINRECCINDWCDGCRAENRLVPFFQTE